MAQRRCDQHDGGGEREAPRGNKYPATHLTSPCRHCYMRAAIRGRVCLARNQPITRFCPAIAWSKKIRAACDVVLIRLEPRAVASDGGVESGRRDFFFG